MDEFISKTKDGIILRVILHPRANKNSIVGLYRDMLKVQVTAPPVGDAANEMLIELLSDNLKIPKSKIKITVGRTSRQKIILIDSDDFDNIKSKIVSLMSLKSSKKEKSKDDDIDLEIE